MAKSKSSTVYICNECGAESSKWMGRCCVCGTWNSMVEHAAVPAAKSANSKPAVIKKLSQVEIKENVRISTGISELDRPLGGGIVPGSLILVSGDPGIGKSTLVLQAAEGLAVNKNVLYFSGEESESQIKMRANRLGVSGENLFFLSHTDIDEIIAAAKNANTEILIIDSVQTMESASSSGYAGSISQIRNSCMLLMEFAKTNSVSVIIIGHVTKDGAIAGPKILEHMVDTVLYFEGERMQTYRILRAVKNRFGSTNEIGVFEMMEDGLFGVENPSHIMLSGRKTGTAGSAALCTATGTRAIMAELQVLVTPTVFGTPRRMCAGLDYNRMVMLLAVIEKNLDVSLGNKDIYINVAGGMKVSETAADLPLAVAIVSAVKNAPVKNGVAAIGEIGLTGEMRFASHIDKRLAELEKMGFTDCIVPKANSPLHYKGKITIHFADTIGDISKLGSVLYG